MHFDDLFVGKQLFVGDGKPEILGRGPAQIRGSSYIEGPTITGDPGAFPIPAGTLMVGPNKNSDLPATVIPGAICGANYSPYSLAVSGDAAIFDNLSVNLNIDAGGNIRAQGEIMSRCGGHILSAKKNFDIPHPTRDGWRLRHTCPEGPLNDVYFRGRVTGKVIELPEYWRNLVELTSITVNLTPVGAHQDVIVKRIEEGKIHLQSKGNMPIDCFFHVYGERKDGEKLIPEYPGSSPADYPGNNDEYSIVGYNYDRR